MPKRLLLFTDIGQSERKYNAVNVHANTSYLCVLQFKDKEGEINDPVHAQKRHP